MVISITRRTFAAALLGAGGLRAAPARTAGMGLMLWNYLLDYYDRLEIRRRTRLQALKTAGDAGEMQARVLARLEEMWGPLPAERTSLNPRHQGTIRKSGYKIEKIIFESRPGFHVAANLYLPDPGAGRHPAVLFPPGDSPQGKADELHQRFCALAARGGVAAMAWDPVGVGERSQLSGRGQSGATAFNRDERELLSRQCVLVGLNAVQYAIWDAIRALDYLESRPEIDAERIGLVSDSGGALEGVQFAAAEPRVKAAFANLETASFGARLDGVPELRQNGPVLYGTLRYGIDHAEILMGIAPRPLLLSSPSDDDVSSNGTDKTFHAVAEAYRLLGAEENIFFKQVAGRGSAREVCESASDWLARWLSPSKETGGEEAVELTSEQDLRCTPAGSVAESLGGVTVFRRNQEYATEIAPDRKLPAHSSEFDVYRSQIANQVTEISRVGTFQPEAGIWLPDRVFEAGVFARGVAVVIAETGKDDPAVRRSVIDPVVAAGYQVVALDLRGWGETAPRMPGLDGGLSWDEFFADRALEIGRPLLGQRMKDLLATSPRRTNRREWIVIGVGAAALVALHSAVLEPRIHRLVTIGGLLSYRSLVDDPLTTQPFSSYLPGVIGAYEIRDLYAALAPRPTLVLNPEDSRRKTVHSVSAWEEFDWVSQVYENVGAAGEFALQSQLSVGQVRENLSAWLRDV